jgi:mannose-1-phosphate guanylyltransferase
MAFIPVVLAGGSGERFWPLSRRAKPKQFLALGATERTLLQATTDRLEPLCAGLDEIYMVTGQAHRALILEQLPDLPLENVLVEPEAKDTAAAILFATLKIAQRHGAETIVGIFPSDHKIDNSLEWQETLSKATALAESQDAIVTLGVKPTFPSTAYGYIQANRCIGGSDAFQVERFVEKPDLETAENYLAQGGYHWNAGIFVFRAQTILNAFAHYAPDMLHALQAAQTPKTLRQAFAGLQKISIDYAILEPISLAGGVLMVPAEFMWDDLGDWNALARMLQGDNPNLEIGTHVGLDTHGGIMYTTSGDDLIVTLGLEDVIIVRDAGVTLVAHKSRTQDIKKLVSQLRQNPKLEKFL